MSTPTPVIIDTNDRDFERDAVERSREVPVVVDFWAPWCGPCRALGPLLERLATEHEGAFLLAKVNVDQNPNLASAFGIRSIPTTLALRNGKVVGEFVGALPESSVQEFLSGILPSDAEQIAQEAEALRAEGKAAEAERAFRRALELDSRCDPALLGLARILSERGESEEALALLDRVSAAGPLRAESDRLSAAIRLGQSGSADLSALRARVEANPGDLEARFALGRALAAAGEYEKALEQYLRILERDRSFADQEPRKAMLDIFEVLGARHETTERYRSELAKVLFS